MKFGLSHCLPGPPPINNDDWFADIVDQILVAEELGFEAILFCEHHFSEAFLPAQLLVCSAIARCTKKIKIGTGVLILPFYNPIVVAEEGATLDWISNGRFILGVGQGYRESEFYAFDVGLSQRGARLKEGVEVIRKLWTEDSVSFRGRFSKFDKVSLRPKPKQKPCPPIWIGAKSDLAVKRAAQIGDGWFADGITPIDILSQRLQNCIQDRIYENPPYTIALAREAFVAKKTDEAWSKVEEHLKSKYRNYFEWGHIQDSHGRLIDPRGADFEAVWEELKSRFVVGSPAKVIEMISDIETALAPQFFMANFRHGAMPEKQITECIQIFGTEVMTHFQTI